VRCLVAFPPRFCHRMKLPMSQSSSPSLEECPNTSQALALAISILPLLSVVMMAFRALSMMAAVFLWWASIALSCCFRVDWTLFSAVRSTMIAV